MTVLLKSGPKLLPGSLVASILLAMLLLTPVRHAAAVSEVATADWPSYGGGYREFHFSDLKQITADNITRLGLAWYYDLPPAVTPFTAPIAIDGVLYFSYGLGVVHAMDAATGKLLWQYDSEVHQSPGRRKMRIAWGIRGVAYLDGKVYTGTVDGRLIALDAANGKVLWSVDTTTPEDQLYISGPPWVFKNTVVIGHGGADFSARGYITAYDAGTGEQRWRFYTVPGNPADGFENGAMSMAAKTWQGEWWKQGGGGTVWHAMAFDPALNQFYIGTGNGAPWNNKIRSEGHGDNLFLTSIVALNADTGEYVWHYQLNPAESWDYNANMDMHLADLEIDGQTVPVLMQAPKNGFFYVLDRRDGKLLSAEKFANVTWAAKIDLETGRPVEYPGIRYPAGSSSLICPSMFGAHNLAAMSFSPLTGLVYFSKSEMCGVFSDPDGGIDQYEPKKYRGSMGIAFGKIVDNMPPIGGSLLAWDPVRQQKAWEVDMPAVNNGGTMATAGNLLFHGSAAGELVAYADDSGRPLWRFDAQTGIQGQPISYLVNGKQYISVIAGWRHVGTGVGLAREWDYRTQPRRVLTFALDAQQPLPPSNRELQPVNSTLGLDIDAGKAARGAAVYDGVCYLCHGMGLYASGAAPDLKRAPSVLSREVFAAILKGASAPLGMPAFDDLDDDEIEGLRHYILLKTREASAH